MAEIPEEVLEEIKEKAEGLKYGELIISIQNGEVQRVNISESLLADDIIKKYKD